MRQNVSLMCLIRRASIVTAVATLFGAWVTDDAQAQRRGEGFFVECPATEVRAEIVVEGLEEGWRGPRNRGRLVDTRIRENQRGRIILQCGYDLFGRTIFFRRPQPEEAAECRAVATGFECVRPRRRGGGGGGGGGELTPVSLRGGEEFDLDRGLRGAGSSDVFIQRRGSVRRSWNMVNNARISLVGREEPRRRDCAQSNLRTQEIDIRELRRGFYYCFETDRGRLGYLVILDVQQRLFSDGRVNFAYRVFRNRN